MKNNQFFENVSENGNGAVATAVKKAPEKKKKAGGKYGNPLGVKIFILCLLIVPLVTFCVFVVYGNLGGLVQAFYHVETENNISKTVFYGLGNFKEFFREWSIPQTYYGGITLKDMVVNSFAYLFLVMFISVPISIIVSFFIYKKVPGSKLAIVLLYMPNILPASILAVYWQSLMNTTQSGFLANIFNFVLGYPEGTNWAMEKANLSLYVYTVYFGFGYNAILIWGAMSRIPEELVEAANLDGANLLREFWNITIPVIWPTLSMVLVFTWMVPFSVVNQPLMIAPDGKYGTATWGVYTMHKLRGGEAASHYVAAMSILSACISLPTTLLFRKALDKVYPVIEV